MQTHLDWNATLTRFSTADTAMNAPGAHVRSKDLGAAAEPLTVSFG